MRKTYRWQMTAHAPMPPAVGTPRRWMVFFVGMASLIAGIAVSITADLGVGSWQVFETGLINATGASFGVVIFVESVLALAFAWAVLGQRPWFATGILAFGGLGIGALVGAITTPEALLPRIALLLIGTLLVTVGVAFYLAADLGASAQDSLFVGLYTRFGIRPSRVRLWMDLSLVVAGVILGGQFGAGTFIVTIAVPLLIEPALRLGHHLARTPLPQAMQRPAPAVAIPPSGSGHPAG